MNKRSFFIASSLLCILLAQPSWGWIGTGHKVVALIAWEDLTPKTREAVTQLLKQHPRYQQDLLENATADETPEQRARTAFAMAATWPDMVRNQDNPMHAAYNHPSWHYIDIPYIVGGQQAKEPEDKSAGPHNIVEALNLSVAALKDTKEKPEQQAIGLCWAAHLVGDIHQPLHATSLFSPQFPNGDQGGNLAMVLRDPPYPDSAAKLHLIWDSLPGDFFDEDMDVYEASGIRADAKYSRQTLADLIAKTDFMGWAQESHDLAVKDVYLNGQLKVGAAEPKGQHQSYASTQSTVPGVPKGYIANAERVALHQVAVGGYRLADLLNSIYDPK